MHRPKTCILSLCNSFIILHHTISVFSMNIFFIILIAQLFLLLPLICSSLYTLYAFKILYYVILITFPVSHYSSIWHVWSPDQHSNLEHLEDFDQFLQIFIPIPDLAILFRIFCFCTFTVMLLGSFLGLKLTSLYDPHCTLPVVSSTA